MKKKAYNAYDEHFKDLEKTLHEGRDRLIARVNDVIVKKGVIDLYPEGPDQQRAIKDLDAAKYALICAIGYYDGRLQELTQWFESNREQLNDYYYSTPDRYARSHFIVELAYKKTLNF